MKSETRNIFSQSMLLGFAFARTSALAQKDPYYDIFLRIAEAEMKKLGISPQIRSPSRSTLSENSLTIMEALKSKYHADCEDFFNLGLTLSLLPLQKGQLSEDMKLQIMLMGAICNLSDSVSVILNIPLNDDHFQKAVADLISYVDKKGRVISRHSSPQRSQDEEKLPSTISDSLELFFHDHPISLRSCFLMMRFRETKPHQRIINTIRNCLKEHGIDTMRSDDKQYHDELFSNILTYMHGCGFGISVYERIEEDSFNPNVSLEVGYMLALGKPVLLLKDTTLRILQTDLIGRLYQPFDPHDPEGTIPRAVRRWLKDKKISEN